jgi:ABC-2 type transport system ATP-binding protein
VAIIRAGRVVDVDEVAVLRERAGQEVVLTFAAPPPPGAFDGLPGVSDLVVDGASVRLSLHGEPDPLLRAALAWRVVRMRAQDRELEDLFLEFYREQS